MPPQPPAPLHRALLRLQQTTTTSRGLPSAVHLTAWGTPLVEADHVAFYFGGMPASAQEPALHSLAANEPDIYRARKMHLICIDKPGMGETPWKYQFSIRRDWPEIVHQVCQEYKIQKYAVLGVSNGGPYVMACLTHPQTAHKIVAAAMIVGVSDVRSSGYFGWRHGSGLMEGLFNSLPVLVTGPLNYLMLSAASLYLFQAGGYQKLFAEFPSLQNEASKGLIRQVIADGVKTGGLGSAVDCQQGLSPLYAGSQEQVQADYASIQSPLSLWYGTQDSTVPLSTAHWLHNTVAHSKLYTKDTGHGLFFHHTTEILEDLIKNMREERVVPSR